MLALNEKALDLLNLLRGEIFTYLHFWIKCCDILAQFRSISSSSSTITNSSTCPSSTIKNEYHLQLD